MTSQLRDGGQVTQRSMWIRSDGVTGVVGDVVVSPPGAGISRALTGAAVPQPLESVFAQRSVRIQAVLSLDQLSARSGPPDTRGRAAGPALEITVPTPVTPEAQVLLETDATGVLRWHLPVAGGERSPEPGVRGADTVFRIPITRIPVPAGPDEATDRGLVAFGVRKVLRLLRFPMRTVGELAGDALVTWWEKRNRPYGLAQVSPTTLAQPIDDRVPTPAEWAALSAGPALLLVHGTFSRARSTFAGLAGATVTELAARYEGRVLAFDHPTLHRDPAANARFLLNAVPTGTRLTLDVLTHSRGGLVARCLQRGIDATRPELSIRTMVHVATPNAGTVLAKRERIDQLLDVMTNALTLFPDDTVAVPLEGIVEAVLQLAQGTRDGLDGLTAMDPDGSFLRDLAGPAAAGCHAVTTDYEPTNGSLAARAIDAVVDTLFGGANDLVVPTRGVYDAGQYQVQDQFVVPPAELVSHTRFFDHQVVRQQLLTWLVGDLTGRPDVDL